MSVVFVVVELEGCFEGAALGLLSVNADDWAARESDVTVPTASGMRLLDAGSVVTFIQG